MCFIPQMLTFEHGADLPDSQAAQTGELAKGQLQEEEWDAAEHQHDEVGQHEGTCVQQESKDGSCYSVAGWKGTRKL